MHTETEHAPPTREDAYNFDMYVVDIIVHHINTKDGTCYIISWYGYKEAGDTAEQSNNIPKRFIKRYWSHLSRQRLKSVNINETRKDHYKREGEMRTEINKT